MTAVREKLTMQLVTLYLLMCLGIAVVHCLSIKFRRDYPVELAAVGDDAYLSSGNANI